MEASNRAPVAPFYAVAVLWLVYGALFPLYAVMHYVLLGLISAGVFFGINVLCKKGGVVGQAEAPEAAPKSKEESTGNAELDKMLKDGRMAVSEMKRLDDNIADAGISADIVRLEQVSQKIFDEVKRDPEKLPQIRKFMDYYLPTTLKMLTGYRKMDERKVEGKNADATRQQIRSAMDVVIILKTEPG